MPVEPNHLLHEGLGMFILNHKTLTAIAASLALLTVSVPWIAGLGTDAAGAQGDVLPSLAKQRIELDGGPTFERLAPDSVIGAAIDKRQIEERARILWPLLEVAEAERVLVVDPHQVPEVRRPLWVVSMRARGGGDPFRALDRGTADAAGRLSYFYQTFDPLTGEPLWAQTSSDR